MFWLVKLNYTSLSYFEVLNIPLLKFDICFIKIRVAHFKMDKSFQPIFVSSFSYHTYTGKEKFICFEYFSLFYGWKTYTHRKRYPKYPL